MTILDVGAKFGIHPAFEDLENLYNFILVDADKEEIQQLKKKYKNKNNIKCLNYFFERKKIGFTKLRLYNHSGKHSYYKLINDKVRAEIKVPTSTIDSIQEKVKFLKIDVEGKESDCLLGGVRQLKNNIIGVRCEVLLNPLYKGLNETFTDVMKILINNNFEFMNFEINKNVSFKSYTKYHCGDIYGKLFATDAIFVKDLKWIMKCNDYKVIIDYAVFCISNNLFDLAIKILKLKKNLIHKNIHKNIHYKKIFFFLEYKIANLFFSLRKIEAYKKLVEKDFKDIFKKSWPEDGSFFKKYELNFKF